MRITHRLFLLLAAGALALGGCPSSDDDDSAGDDDGVDELAPVLSDLKIQHATDGSGGCIVFVKWTAKDKDGRTPLYEAGLYGHTTGAEQLQKAGAKSGPGEENSGPSSFLTQQIHTGEAYIWLMKRLGYIVRTWDHVFVIDNEETGRKPDTPSVDNGFPTAQELADQNVIALYSAYHAEPETFEFIHGLEDQIKNITYLHYKDDRWRGGNKGGVGWYYQIVIQAWIGEEVQWNVEHMHVAPSGANILDSR